MLQTFSKRTERLDFVSQVFKSFLLMSDLNNLSFIFLLHPETSHDEAYLESHEVKTLILVRE